MGKLEMAAVLFVILSALLFGVGKLAIELHHLLLKAKNKRIRKKNRGSLVGVNPREGRTILYATVIGERLRHLSWSCFVANNPDATEGIKNLAEVQSIDNANDIDTFKMSKWLYKDSKLYQRIVSKIRESSKSYAKRCKSSMRRLSKAIAVRMKSTTAKVRTTITTIISFLYRNGGLVNNEEDDKSIKSGNKI